MALVLASLLKWKEDFFVPCPQISELNLHTSLYDIYVSAIEHIVDVAVAYGGVAVAQTCYHIFIYYCCPIKLYNRKISWLER